MTDDEFGSWMSGFTDAEGCFFARVRASGRAETSFHLVLRDDDRAVLDLIRARLGVGAICRNTYALARSRGGKDRDCAQYRVFALSEKIRLIEFFDRNPLQSKKRNDYAIWRQAVLAEAGGEPTRDLGHYVEQIREARAYGPAESGPILEMPEAAFGHWAAGFCDGESCFSMYRRTSGRARALFQVKIRDDDQAVLDTIRARLGVGAIYRKSKSSERGRGRKDSDQVSYEVSVLAEKVQLVRFLDEHPLRSKKARDFAIWREAVLAEAAGESTRDLVRFIQPLRDARAYPTLEGTPA